MDRQTICRTRSLLILDWFNFVTFALNFSTTIIIISLLRHTSTAYLHQRHMTWSLQHVNITHQHYDVTLKHRSQTLDNRISKHSSSCKNERILSFMGFSYLVQDSSYSEPPNSSISCSMALKKSIFISNKPLLQGR